jgi:hypothetical protein
VDSPIESHPVVSLETAGHNPRIRFTIRATVSPNAVSDREANLLAATETITDVAPEEWSGGAFHVECP